MGQTKLIEDEGCKLCDLHKTRNNIVWYRGTSEKDVDVVLVGEAPGKEEDLSGRPFVGRAGKILDKWIEEAELTNYAIVNIVKCRPPDNRKPFKSEINACLPYLVKQIKDMNPKIIVSLGAVPSSVLVNKKKILENIGKLFQCKYGKVIIFPHPSFILRGMKAYIPTKELKEIVKRLKIGDK
jgi:uracil-DNA glycosylase family 4